jgi:hypothetical protein
MSRASTAGAYREVRGYSQTGQDMFAYILCATDSGTFLDIGACYPVSANNTSGPNWST